MPAAFARATVAIALLAAACANPERERLEATTRASYDASTGKLTELTYDANKNGRIDTWTEMDGTRPVRSRLDQDEDGRIDRWEYYDGSGRLAKVGFSRSGKETPDAWAYASPSGGVERVEVSSQSDPDRIDRWEYYDAKEAGNLVRVEEDTNGDGKPDKWERYTNGEMTSAEFDETRDGRPDRRLTYKEGVLVLIESAPDASGTYTKSQTPR